jgi:hypothetical protein
MSQAVLRWANENFDVTPFLKATPRHSVSPAHLTSLGALYAADCMKVLPLVASGYRAPPFGYVRE